MIPWAGTRGPEDSPGFSRLEERASLGDNERALFGIVWDFSMSNSRTTLNLEDKHLEADANDRDRG
jgi:hypothetical protein